MLPSHASSSNRDNHSIIRKLIEMKRDEVRLHNSRLGQFTVSHRVNLQGLPDLEVRSRTFLKIPNPNENNENRPEFRVKRARQTSSSSFPSPFFFSMMIR